MAKLPQFLSGAGRGGFRRPLLIGTALVGAVAAVVVVSSIHHTQAPGSRISRQAPVNALPGGLQTNPQQEALAKESDQEASEKAAREGRSFTPPFSAGRPNTPAEVGGAGDPGQTAQADRGVHPVAVPDRPVVQVDQRFAAPSGPSRAVDPNATKLYDGAIARVLQQWGGRTPQTELAMATTATPVTQTDRGPARPATAGASAPSTSSLVSSIATGNAARILIPAGRGVYAHTVVAVDSDTGGPIVLQADSGPIAGDRMIGSFSKAGGHENLLVVQVTRVIHNGEEISAAGMVIAPATMQTAVASSVDEHYFSRFVLPAAAAFVQGLGSALATTSNTYSQIGPLGNTSYVTSLNFPQQVGIGAGVAAQQIGSALTQQAPTGPTIHLDANANVGVIFTVDIKSHGTSG